MEKRENPCREDPVRETVRKAHPPITPEDEEAIDQVAASMALSGMHLDKDCYERLYQLASGEKTLEEVIAELDEKYRQ